MDYTKMPYPPFEKSTVERLNEFSEFKKFKIENKDKFVYYLVLVYDRASDLFILHRDGDLYQRKREAALRVGFTLNKEGVFDEYVEKVLVGENEAFNLCQFRYIRLSGIPDLPVLIKYTEMLDREMSMALPEKPKDREYVRNNINQLLKEIEELEVKIFTGKESEAARESLYRLLERMKLGLRPEEVAQSIKEGDVKNVLYGTTS